jgi:hypothetical protein
MGSAAAVDVAASARTDAWTPTAQRFESPAAGELPATGVQMRVIRGFTAAAICAGAAVGFAWPAQADVDFGGTYIRAAPGVRSTWVVTPCGPGCAHIADSSGWSADARPFGALWRFEIDLPDATRCNDGRRAPGTVTFKVDAARSEGTAVTIRPAPCPLAPATQTRSSSY